jgi:uncharacterized coiled-coil DUF342 family protein
MKTYTAPDKYQDDPQRWDYVNKRLNDILTGLEQEAAFRQGLLVKLEEQLDWLKGMCAKKDNEIIALRDQLQECRQVSEGTRQLMNKLLNDIDNYRKDIDWYQRTYEKRSLPGTIWQKLFRKRST